MTGDAMDREIDLMAELEMADGPCPRGCGRTLEECEDDENPCEGSPLVRELEAQLAQATEELGHYKRVVNGSVPDHLMGRHDKQPADGCLMCQRAALVDDNTRLAGKLAKARTLIEAAKAWRELVRTRGTVYALDSRAADLIAAVDALVATEPSADVPSPVAASGRTSNEDGADVGVCDHWMHGLDKYPRGSSMSFTDRAMDEITAHRAVCPLLADSRAGQAGEEVA